MADTPTRTTRPSAREDAAETPARESGSTQVMEAAPEAAPVTITGEEFQANVEAEVKSAFQELSMRPELGKRLEPEIGEPLIYWDVAAYGPVQFTQPGGPLEPHQVIKVGEQAFVAAIVLLNPQPVLPGPLSPCNLLGRFSLPFEVQYQTGDLTRWVLGEASMQGVHSGRFDPNNCYYVDWIGFTPRQPGLYEMNISARVLAAAPPLSAPNFGAYATTVFRLDGPGLFGPQPPGPLRFQVYA